VGKIDYRQSGVDIDAGNETVRRIKELARTTYTPGVLSGVGAFGGLFGLDAAVREPVLVASADGVGTKLKVAFLAGVHDTVGIDLVNHCVNDILVQGARPLFFLDYLATGRLAPDVAEQIVRGVAAACRENGCALLGGETAEMPGMYADGHYDLAAFAVGVVERDRLLGPRRVREGDAVIGLLSSGLHSNGYSLARRALLDPEHGGLALSDPLPTDPSTTVGDALLVPTTIYVEALTRVQALGPDVLHAAAHITGGGLIDNPPRVLPETLSLLLSLRDVPRPPIMEAIAAQGVDEAEMRRTFNCGVGMMLIVEASRADEVIAAAEAADYRAVDMGQVKRRREGDPPVKFAD
jgi:phosphoribosylformylglycinamidine cyclo-ligase